MTPGVQAINASMPLYPLTTNVHKKNIVGVGLALYYNQLVFVACVAAMAWAGLHLEDAGLMIKK